jgi:hypothetical protein
MMVLYVCRAKGCGFFRDMTPMYPFYTSADSVPLYNTTVTHCPDGHGEMYQVQKGDRLAVIEEEKERVND